MKTIKLWVVIADEAIARIFEWQALQRRLQEIETLANTSGLPRQTAAPWRCDFGDRDVDMPDPAVVQTRDDDDTFIHTMACRLTEARLCQRFDRLWMLAPQRFLGRLRQVLRTEDMATMRLDPQDLSRMNPRDLARQLFPNA